MPSARFLKLKGPKKIKILEAAMKEFLMHPVTMVSINQIIKSAGISRAVFIHILKIRMTFFNMLQRTLFEEL